MMPSFNPCFCGTRSRSLHPDKDQTQLVQFQSLFLWNSLPEARLVKATVTQRGSFNPCFCGTRSRRGQMVAEPTYLSVSILVFVELAPGVCTHVVDVPLYVFRFNPCFCGTRSRRIFYHNYRTLYFLVSILVFVELAPGDFYIFIILFIKLMFQSLFLWNSLPEEKELQYYYH